MILLTAHQLVPVCSDTRALNCVLRRTFGATHETEIVFTHAMGVAPEAICHYRGVVCAYIQMTSLPIEL